MKRKHTHTESKARVYSCMKHMSPLDRSNDRALSFRSKCLKLFNNENRETKSTICSIAFLSSQHKLIIIPPIIFCMRYICL